MTTAHRAKRGQPPRQGPPEAYHVKGLRADDDPCVGDGHGLIVDFFRNGVQESRQLFIELVAMASVPASSLFCRASRHCEPGGLREASCVRRGLGIGTVFQSE